MSDLKDVIELFTRSDHSILCEMISKDTGLGCIPFQEMAKT